jgi:limonene-1,2-epoxide hydrolase
VASDLERFEEAVDALNRVDLDAMRRICDPEIVFVPLRAAITGAFIGHRGMEDFVAENAERFESFTGEFDELRALPGGRVLAIGHIHMRAKGGGETKYRTAGIAAFRDGRMVSWHDYGSVEAALEAAGE